MEAPQIQYVGRIQDAPVVRHDEADQVRKLVWPDNQAHNPDSLNAFGQEALGAHWIVHWRVH